MPLIRLAGHESLRKRLSDAIAHGTLPASLLLHGPAGGGKERLALWIAARLLCDTPTAGGEPCEACAQCRYVLTGQHPDLHWYFPRPRLKDADPDVEDVLEDLAEAISERLEKTGVWEPAAPTDSLYVATVRALVRRASMMPALAKRKVIVVADADRMIAQEGSDQAANAFLKLLEEPSPGTNIILTTSSPGSLLPTIRSRVSAIRVAALPASALKELAALGVNAEKHTTSRKAAAAFISAAEGSVADRYRLAFVQGGAGARGAFSETLDALTALLAERAREAAAAADERRTAGAARAVALVEDARQLARQNVNPQLISARLLSQLTELIA